MTRLMRLLILFAFPFAFAAAVSAQTTPANHAASGFPHATHAKLFLMCSSCHSGIPSGDAALSFPSTALCAACHDGTVEKRVAWTGPARREVGLIIFSHPAHFAKVKDVACESCHSLTNEKVWMNVGRDTPERCVACHAHSAAGHFADDNKCSTCHRTLAAATALTDAQVAALPKPPSHFAADFVSTHGPFARSANANCATCHAKESCQRCHVDGARVPIIRSLANDVRVARLENGKLPSYPEPADHKAVQFALTHGKVANADIARCATCHARSSCETCHIGDGARDMLRKLPDAREATAPGVQLRQATPATSTGITPFALVSLIPPQQSQSSRAQDTTTKKVNVHPPGFIRVHRTMAASGELNCASCHAQRFCSDCHAGEKVTRKYHPNDFVSTHAPQAYSRETDCASCHSTEAFCRACHRQTGLAAKTNARSTVFHNAQALWLLQHGRAARQDLPSCTTCHQQTYCMQCHSDLGARINPHGPGFDAARMASKNPGMCLTCHFKNPLAK
ncbi:MAG: cytochrome c3 family protein [Gemmatimonadaceae bacterium]